MTDIKKYFIYFNSIVETKSIGINTKIWAFVHILENAKIGNNCNICDHCFIENNVTIGNNVTIKSGVYLWDGISIEDDVFIGPNVVFTNDKRPRSKEYLAKYPETIIKKGASLGANSTILPGITIGRYAMIGAGSVVTKDVDDFTLVTGNPAKFRSYICRCTKEIKFTNGKYTCACGQKYKLESGKVINIYSN
jgi:acetyltransferase-like isoleucine patch superfamily enzyme